MASPPRPPLFLAALCLGLLLATLAGAPTRPVASARAQGLAETVTPSATFDPVATATYAWSMPLSSTLTNTLTATPTETLFPTATLTSTETTTPTPTQALTVTLTATATPTATEKPSLHRLFLPVLFKNWLVASPTPSPSPSATITPTPTVTPTGRPPATNWYCDSLDGSLAIPDNVAAGISDSITISDGRQVAGLSLYLDIRHSWVGDLRVTLSHQQTGQSIVILDRPGVPASNIGCQYDHVIALFEDRATQATENKCASSPAGISGTYLPVQPLSTFAGSSAAGPWVLTVSDNYAYDTGSLRGWCLETTLVDTLPPPPPTAPPPTATPANLPASARIWDISGANQAMPLDCEIRSAVDWAAYFDRPIGETAFFNNLPKSDDPDSGFVGNVYGSWGQIPPNDYGVHAQPIAGVLRSYGVAAFAYRSVTYDELRAEIAAGRPVIVWIVGGSNKTLVNGIPRVYTANSNHHTTIVAAYEHTVIAVGYTETSVIVLNGNSFVTVPLNQFLDSWSALRNMAVLAR
ncbi:MAG TPA: C39 family peptidase [Anaerolineales bacterium]|nr:C39 family peptidase [Anaerolineales bacterium]